MIDNNATFEFRSKHRDYSISFVRFIAMCFIVMCHFMQRDGFATTIKGAQIEWAFWFNIGVQMFLFISGFLYGTKSKIDIIEFYKKNFPKLLIDYYVFIILMLALIHWSPLMSIDQSDVIMLLTFSGTVPGLGHLWFVPTILFCYLLAPIFSEIINAIDKRSNLRFGIESIILLIITHEVIVRFYGYFSPAWVNCFIIGMLYSRIERRGIAKAVFNVLITFMCLFIIPIQFRIDYWPHGDLPASFTSIYSHFVSYGHVFLGIAAVLAFRLLYYKINFKSQKHVLLKWSDKYSYDVYLVHHVFVQSPFGCVEFIQNKCIAIPLAIALTLLFSVVLHAISEFIRSKCIEVYRELPN